MTTLQLDTLDVQQSMNLYPEITGDQKCAELLRSMYETVILALESSLHAMPHTGS